MSQEAVMMLLCWGMFPTLLLVAVVMKARDVYRARRWPSTPGKVLVSETQAKIKAPGDPGFNFHDTEVENLPRVEYEYKVDGKTYRNGRITIGEKTSEYEIEEILERYPIGAEVTVFYDPANPQTAVLDRDVMDGKLLLGCALLALIFGVLPLAGIFGYEYGVAWLKANKVHNGPFIAAATGFGLLALLFALGYTAMIFQATRWPTTQGRIVSSGVQQYEVTDEGTTSTQYKVSVVYSYEVRGRKFTSDRLRMGVVIGASFPGHAKRTARYYPVGGEVTVYYNPKKPSDAVLHPYTNLFLLPWLMAAAVLWLAWAVATGQI